MEAADMSVTTTFQKSNKGEITKEMLAEATKIFSEHYGVWARGAPPAAESW